MITINEAMVLMKQVRERMNDLNEIRMETTIKRISRRGYGDTQTEEIVEPQYGLKAVDKKITELQNWLYRADAEVKQSNARTEITILADVGTLLAPLE